MRLSPSDYLPNTIFDLLDTLPHWQGVLRLKYHLPNPWLSPSVEPKLPEDCLEFLFNLLFKL